MTIIIIDMTKSNAIVSSKIYLVLQQLSCSVLQMSLNQYVSKCVLCCNKNINIVTFFMKEKMISKSAFAGEE